MYQHVDSNEPCHLKKKYDTLYQLMRQRGAGDLPYHTSTPRYPPSGGADAVFQLPRCGSLERSRTTKEFIPVT
ncbi:hypothetical protein TNCV_4519661 [Trichonephila clavipes]|nr:hypothetical protein TNCV_4519661 [Trichonephila clavipes]